jgi:hypothetical protein
VVERAWGVNRDLRSPWEQAMQEQIPSGNDATDDKAVIQNQDLEHQRETHVSNKGVKVPAPMVDSPARRDVEEEENRTR